MTTLVCRDPPVRALLRFSHRLHAKPHQIVPNVLVENEIPKKVKEVVKPQTVAMNRVTTHPHALHPESHVSSLIDHDTGNWRIGLIKEIFLPHDAQAILSIPLSIQRPPNRMVWAFTPKG
ncbi:hypothetical protein CFP56_042186 [Quercus suber]|uniref:Uncharacterized protein n=1 Tax=Quercus suber TaxID=58331 RepID=A0AAW0MBJ6_QUESU